MFRAVQRVWTEAANLYESRSSTQKKQLGEAYEGKKLVIGNNSIKVASLVAEGGFSFIYKATSETSLQPFALKRTLCLDKESLDMAMTEVQVLEQLPPHPNIVRYYGSVVHPLGKESQGKEVLILLEWCDGSSLAHLLFSSDGRVANSWWSESRIAEVFRDACSAVAHLHEQLPPIIHRDIKLENIIQSNSDNCFKLCDFGSCCFDYTEITSRKERLEQEYILQKQSTFMYRAPEMIDLYGNKKLTEKVDIWALGCILYVLCYRKHPFETGSAVQILNGKVDIPTVPSYSSEWRQLILDMLQVDPDKRPTASNVVRILESLQSRNSTTLFSNPENPCTEEEEDWAHFDEEPSLIQFESPVSSKEKHILDCL
ncbi:hypothetical protein GAYE_SCF05G2623 [Galdieria yellowstonensis]|uniref:non-specific serine/threonine protein kinase n=1 Tax=Galdieria yellowstonensis TaxID=3028027 RepID=A0AAV9IBD4_9RHOD|nr:hypothetical protein GAYE_SCF05G2623 [Galdieria yellowstonensis]